MRRRGGAAPPAALLLALWLCACGSSTVHLVDDDASGDATTPAFTTHSAWQLQYSWDCSNQVARGVSSGGQFSYQLFYADDDTLSAEQPQLSRKGSTGSGKVSYLQPGPYYVQVSSPCKWRVQVVTTS